MPKLQARKASRKTQRNKGFAERQRKKIFA